MTLALVIACIFAFVHLVLWRLDVHRMDAKLLNLLDRVQCPDIGQVQAMDNLRAQMWRGDVPVDKTAEENGEPDYGMPDVAGVDGRAYAADEAAAAAGRAKHLEGE